MAKEVSEVPNVEIPAEFDVRTAFPDCAEVSGNIRDQSSCGSCWAFGSTEAFNDRHCIATGSMGCNGGQPGQAWNWFKNKGVVTGGDYFDIGAGDTCGPYTLAPCAHHVPATEKYPACPSSEYPSPKCKKTCEDAYPGNFNDDKLHASKTYSVRGETQIMQELVNNGPMYVSFSVYSDFPTYSEGVYQNTGGSFLGGHAVTLVGYGELDGTPYWKVKNSWNEEWGNGGHFLIRRGTNECGIEGDANAGDIQTSVNV